MVAATSELPSSDDAAVASQSETPERVDLIETNVAERDLPPAPDPGKKRRRRKGRNKAQA